jgi:hypothetical protein
MTQENYFLYTCIEYKFEILTLSITIKFQNFNKKQDFEKFIQIFKKV